jgi:hypothetical protein
LASVVAVLTLAVGWPSAHAAPAPAPAAAPGETPAEAPPPEPANWRFRKRDRPVKLILVAGSIGAWPKQPYIKQIERMCPRVEAKNLSKVGQGAYALKQRFKQQVLENRYLPFHDDSLEFWLAFQGGLNSVGMPEKTNRYIRDLFVLAHRRGMRVLGLSLTPWGDHKDKKRWVGANALHYKRATQKIVDFVVGRASPREALGVHVSRRSDPGAPWSAEELADVGIDLYDSPLRDPSAPMTDVEEAKSQLRADRRWARDHAELSPEDRERALERDARELAEVQRWWLRPELRSFDHIHPNVEGHGAMASWMCPQLPASWGAPAPTREAAFRGLGRVVRGSRRIPTSSFRFLSD